MQDTTEALVGHYLDHLDLSGDVLEIHADAPDLPASLAVPRARLRRVAIDDIDLTDGRDVLADASFDVVVTTDVLEHLERPWRAAGEIGRILRPGGVAVVHTPFSWAGSPRRDDYWRFSAAGLRSLFADLECLETGYDVRDRDRDRWGVYCVARRGSGATVRRFADSDHPLAGHLRTDTQAPVADPLLAVRPELGEVSERLAGLERLIVQRTRQLDDIAARSKRLERRLERLSASLPVRAARSVRNGLHTLLK